MFNKVLALGCLVLVIAACGGGGSSTDPNIVDLRTIGLYDSNGDPLIVAPATGSPPAVVRLLIRFKPGVAVDETTVRAAGIDNLNVAVPGSPYTMNEQAINEFFVAVPLPVNTTTLGKTYKFYITGNDLSGNALAFESYSGEVPQSGANP
jgi:hypothetical protein